MLSKLVASVKDWAIIQSAHLEVVVWDDGANPHSLQEESHLHGRGGHQRRTGGGASHSGVHNKGILHKQNGGQGLQQLTLLKYYSSDA